MDLRRPLIIALAAGTICFVNLGAPGLWDLDEALYASIAREMSARGDWIVPTFNASVFFDKPPLMFWLMMGSFKTLGVNEFAARLPAAILAIATALATYRLARRLFSPEVGLWAGLITTSNVIFTVSARAATVDSALTLITVLVMALFAKGARLGAAVEEPRETDSPQAGRRGDNPSRLALLPDSWRVNALLGLLLGLAVLAKGPIGLLLPAASLGLFLLIMNPPPAAGKLVSTGRPWASLWQAMRLFAPRNMLRVTWAMRPLTVLAFAALVALPWFTAITWQTHGQWLEQFVAKYNLGPFIRPFLGHRGPFYYHFAVVLVGLFPWSVFLGPTIVNTYRSLRARGKDFPSLVFVVCWIAVFFGFWSACSTKLPHYVLPAYPALAILTGYFIQAWIERAETTARLAMSIATTIFLGVGGAMAAVLPLVTARFAPGEGAVALIGIIPAAGGALGWYLLVRNRRRAYMAAFAMASVLFITALFGWAAVRIDHHQHSRPLMEALRRDCPATPQIAGYRYCDASTVFYAGGPVAECDDAGKLRAWIARSPHPYVVAMSGTLKDLREQIPGPWRVVARRPRFLGKGEIVVLTPQAAVEGRAVAATHDPQAGAPSALSE